MAACPSALGAGSLVSSDVFVAEHYLGGTDPLRAETLTRLLRASAAGLRHALFLPADDTFFAVYDGASAEVVSAAIAGGARSPGSLDRIVRAILLDPVPPRLTDAPEDAAAALTVGHVTATRRNPLRDEPRREVHTRSNEPKETRS